MEFAVALDRVIAAPRAKVYRAWLDPEVLAPAGWARTTSRSWSPRSTSASAAPTSSS